MLVSVLLWLFMMQLFCPSGAVKTLNEILPLIQVDAYAPCLRARGDTYCFVSAKLGVGGNASHPLYNNLLEHSSNKFTHFDRTKVHRGICLKRCREYSRSNVSETVEACLNASLTRDHGLTAKGLRTLCSEYRESVQFDASDATFGAVLLMLVVLNLLGSVYDFCGGNGEHSLLGRLLLCFAVRSNWRRLVAPASSDPKQRRLLSLSGYRAILSLSVILGHAGIGSHFALGNSDYLEETYNQTKFMILYRGLEILHLYFIISAILLAYNVLASGAQLTWRNLPMVLLWRWLRFTPTYALLLFFYGTWARHVGEGPFWRATVEVEANDCRRDWWLHLLYIQNYVDNSRCMVHTWSTAADMQLTIVGVAIFLLTSDKARKTAIALLLAAGLAILPAVIYFKNLHPVLITSPELFLNWVAHDPTFNNLYKRGHTNLVCYGLGLVLAYIIFNLKESDFGANKYKMYRPLHWLLVPLGYALGLTGAVFFVPRAAVPLAARLLYSSAVRLACGLVMCAHVFLTVVDVDGLQSRIFRWRGWTPLGRLAFCVYLIHLGILRFRAGVMDTTYHISIYTVLQTFVETTIASFLLALPLFLMVEAPFAQLTRLCLTPRHAKKHVD